MPVGSLEHGYAGANLLETLNIFMTLYHNCLYEAQKPFRESHHKSGRTQNIAEGSMASGTSKKFELKLVGVARASLEELLLDFKDYLRQKGLPLWAKDHPKAGEVRKLCYQKIGLI